MLTVWESKGGDGRGEGNLWLYIFSLRLSPSVSVLPVADWPVQ